VQAHWGTVLACQANYYWVQIDRSLADLPENENLQVLCTRRARLKKLGQQVRVGDRVRLEELDWVDRRGAIAFVQPRRTLLDRPPVANVEQILLMFAFAEPQLDPIQLSRFLVKAESTGIPVSLALNKQDLISRETRLAWQQRLQQWGYHPISLSLQAQRSLPPDLIEQLQHRITVVAGPSGVGKSSLINRLIPSRTVRTGSVSGKLGRGRHTTRHVELFELPLGGFLADTPGFNQPDIQCSAPALAKCFPEIQARLIDQTCQFNDCLHRDEPGCAVRDSWERYEHYRLLLDEVLHYQQTLEQRPDAEAAEKVKIGDAGQVQHEPRLEARKYRKTSRRSRNQSLQDIRHDLSDLDNLEDLDDDTQMNDFGF
jgi:ribosome biogenesis GTPase